MGKMEATWLVLLCYCYLVGNVQATPHPETFAQREITLASMHFTYTDPDPKITHTTLTMCGKAALTESPASTQVTVTFGETGSEEKAVEGIIVETDNTCAVFEIDYRVPETDLPTTYTLVVLIPVVKSTMASATATFPMTEVVSQLSCGEKTLFRVSWSDTDTSVDPSACLKTAPSGQNMVCYRENDLTSEDMCFTKSTAVDMTICRIGGVAAINDPKTVTVNYLAYDAATQDQAHMPLTFDGHPSKNLEVTLWRGADDTAPTVLSCYRSLCEVTSFEPSNTVYEMCAFSDDAVPQYGYATIEDVNLVAFDMGEDPLFIEFGFVNSNAPSFLYTATLYSLLTTPASPTAVGSPVNLDCTGVTEGNLCYGFLSTDVTPTGTLYLSIQHTSDAFESPSNMIATTLQPGSGRGRNLGHFHHPSTILKEKKHFANTDA